MPTSLSKAGYLLLPRSHSNGMSPTPSPAVHAWLAKEGDGGGPHGMDIDAVGQHVIPVDPGPRRVA